MTVKQLIAWVVRAQDWLDANYKKYAQTHYITEIFEKALQETKGSVDQCETHLDIALHLLDSNSTVCKEWNKALESFPDYPIPYHP